MDPGDHPAEVSAETVAEKYDAFSTDPSHYLSEFADNWKVDSGVADARGEITSELAAKTVTKVLSVEQTSEERTVRRSEYDEATDERVGKAERYEHAPSDFSEKTIEYVQTGVSPHTCENCDGHGEVTCNKCRGRELIDCPNCGGDGIQDCEECGGSKELTCANCGGSGEIDAGPSDSDRTATCTACNGSGSVGCSRCNSSGTHRCTKCGGERQISCPKCSGSGTLVCGTCKGDGEMVTAEFGRLEFEHSVRRTGDTAMVPGSEVAQASNGRKLASNLVADGGPRRRDGESAYRKRITRYEIPAMRVDYSFGDDEHELYVTGSDANVEVDSYPKSTTRKAVTLAAGGIAILLLVGALAYFGVITLPI